ALERAASVDAAATEPRRLTDGVEPGDGGAVAAQHAALEIGLDAAQALAREDELAHRHQRQRLLVVDLLELADADAIAAVAAEVLQAAQLVVVVVGGAAHDLAVVVADGGLDVGSVYFEAEQAALIHLLGELGDGTGDGEVVGALADQPLHQIVVAEDEVAQ